MAKKALPPAFLANAKKKQDAAKAKPAGAKAKADKKPAFLKNKGK
jgi:hypothetical protein